MRAAIVMTLSGITLLLGAGSFRAVVDPIWLQIPGAAVVATGIRLMILAFAERYGRLHVPSWLGIALLVALASIIPILVLAR